MEKISDRGMRVSDEGRNANRQTLIFTAVLAFGALLAACVRLFPSINAAYVVCPWIYLPCFLFVSRFMTRKVDYLLWIIFWCGSFAVRFWGILEPFNLGISIVIQLAAAVIFSLPFWADKLVWRKGPPVARLLVFPFACAAFDCVMEWLYLGSMFSLAQTQFDNKPLLQLASVLGSKGIVFVLALSASFIVCNLKNTKRILIWLLVLLVLHVCGMVRISVEKPVIDGADKLTIGWSAEPVTDDSFFCEVEDTSLNGNAEYLRKALDDAKAKGVELLCFPEETFSIDTESYEAFIKEAQNLAREYGISILLSVESGNADYSDVNKQKGRNAGEDQGAEENDDEEETGINEALFIDADGNIQDDYMKSKLIPVAEEPYYEDGSGVLPDDYVRIGDIDLNISYAICFDGDFGSYIRTMPEDTNLFIDISWDWDQVDDFHYRIIGLRAVENGVTVVKPTVCGYSTVTDYIGRLHSKTHSDDTGYSGVNLIELPIAAQITIYRQFGVFIDILYVIGLVVLLGVGLFFRRKDKL